jgi:hypothetical protein
MRWLRIGVDEVQLRAKYVIEGSARRPEALTIAFDRRWELMEDSGAIAGLDVADEPDGRQSVRVPLPADELDRNEVTLQWRLTGTELFGRLRLPLIQLISIPATERWLAISSDPEVECELVDGAALPGAVNEFLAMWGEAEDAPQLVVGSLPTAVPWSVAVRPRQKESLIDEVLHVAAGGDVLRVVYQAVVAPGRAHEFQYQLIVPADLSIDEIALTDAGRRIPVRWARVGDTRVNIFFDEQVASEYRLALRGSVPADVDATRSLPRVTAVSRESATQNVQLYREEGVLVAVSGVSEADQLPVKPRDPPPAAWTARPIGVYRLDKTAFDAVRLTITPNNVQITGPTLLSLTRDAEAWSAGFGAHLTVKHGQLDMLRLRAPATWTGPFSLASDAPASMELDAADPGGTTLVIRFADSIKEGNTVDLTVRGQLMQAAQSPISMPAITPEPMVRGKRYLQVPSHWAAQPIAWAEAGVRPAELPDDLGSAVAMSENTRTFEVVDFPFRVAVEPTAAHDLAAQVRLADTTVWAAASGGQLIETRLVIAAPELPHCNLQLPRDQDLVSVRLDEHSAIIQPIDSQQWRVSFGPMQLPQTLEIVSRARPADGDRQELERPRLMVEDQPVPVEVSLWSIVRPQADGPLRISGAKTVTEADQAAFRLDRLLGIVEAATPVAVEAPHPDGYRWYRFWAERLNSLRQEAVEKMEALGGREPSQVSSAEEQLTRASERLDLWIEQSDKLLAIPGLEEEPTSGGNDSPTLAAERSPVSQWIYCVAEGGASELIVDSASTAATPRQIRLVGLLAITCAAAASVWLIRRPAAVDFLYRWPHAITFVVGLVYWAWLWPSWLGLVIAAGSLLSTWWHGWPGRSLPMERSTVLRVPQSEVVAP